MFSHLTPRQVAIVRLVVTGWTNKQIARSLGITEGTVKAHMHAILGKCEIRSRVELIVKLRGVS